LSTVVGAFKSAVTKRINRVRGTPAFPAWQKDYYERVIRDDAELHRIREYIVNNPAQWEFDQENPDRAERGERET